jgi:hypothetical protein
VHLGKRHPSGSEDYFDGSWRYVCGDTKKVMIYVEQDDGPLRTVTFTNTTLSRAIIALYLENVHNPVDIWISREALLRGNPTPGFATEKPKDWFSDKDKEKQWKEAQAFIAEARAEAYESVAGFGMF